VTDQDKPAFAQAFNRMAVALRLPAAEVDPAMQQIYFDALKDLPVAAVVGAVGGLTQSAGYGFPRTSEWHSVAERCRIEQTLKALPSSGREEPWHHECPHCEDTGWEIRECDGSHRQCGRAKEHQAHSYASACSCRNTNATYARHHRVPRGRETYAESA
jgi:hypothetical protein